MILDIVFISLSGISIPQGIISPSKTLRIYSDVTPEIVKAPIFAKDGIQSGEGVILRSDTTLLHRILPAR